MGEGIDGEGVVDLGRISCKNMIYSYDHSGGYPRKFPLDRYLFDFINNYIPIDMEVGDPLLARERCRLEWVILQGRDSMLGAGAFSYPSYSNDFLRQQ